MNYKILKKTVIVSIGACIVASVLTVVLTNWNYEKYIRENNMAILRMVELLLEEENLTTEDIAQHMQSSEEIDWGILEDYGYEVGTEFFLENNEMNLKNNIIFNLAIVNGMILLSASGFYMFLWRREKKVNELILYLQELQEQNYGLKIQENDEDELSKLQNEIYKITVQLKEQAETSILDKSQIKDNIVDISHQLKTPLTSMLIMTDNLMEYPDMDKETKRIFLENIQERISHMEVLIQNLLKLSRFDANVIEFKKEEIQVWRLIENVVENNQALLKQKHIDLQVECDERIRFVGDFTWQCEAISNILKNAIEHSAIGGSIEISSKENNFTTKILVKDYGSGIKKENIKKIFTRYYKDTNSSETSIGVGLNLAKTIVEKDHGIIKVKSVENEFTTFEIRYVHGTF